MATRKGLVPGGDYNWEPSTAQCEELVVVSAADHPLGKCLRGRSRGCSSEFQDQGAQGASPRGADARLVSRVGKGQYGLTPRSLPHQENSATGCSKGSRWQNPSEGDAGLLSEGRIVPPQIPA